MNTKKYQISPVTIALIITVLVLLVVLIVLTIFSLPAMMGGTSQEPLRLSMLMEESTEPPVEAPTEEPTEPPTDPPLTLPPPEENPFGNMDFQYEDGYLRLRDGESYTGIDVSHWQKLIDWDEVKASGVDFAMIRLGYRGYELGNLNLDSYAIANLDNAIVAGLDVGVYFFSQAVTPEEAEEEAYFVIEKLEPYKGLIKMPVAFDWEHVGDSNARTANMQDPDILTDCALAFLQTIEAEGYQPMVYFNRTQSWKYLNLEELKQYDFWLAAYTQRMEFPYKINMWQYTDKGQVPGVTGNCDINVYLPDT